MKNKILILITMFFSLTSCAQSGEKKLQKLLLSGSLKPTSYRMDDVDRLERIKGMYIEMRDDCYEIVITDTGGDSEYFTFKAEKVTAKRKVIKGQISRVSMEQNDWAYVDDKASGAIEAHTENRTVKIEIAMNIYQKTVKYVIEFEIMNNMIEEPPKTDTIEKDVVKDDMYYFNQQLAIVNADYGTCYTIGDYQLCPEKKLIKVMRMFGTAVKDAMGFFPDTTLKYHEETMIIFAGNAFFDKSNLKIDWQTVQLLSYSDHYSEFTDGKTLYYIRYGSAHTNGVKYDKNTYKRDVEKQPAKINHPKFRELTENFHIKGNLFVYGSLMYGDEVVGDPDFNWKEIWKNFEFKPILEPFDVPNLRTIVSASGFETDYITDGKQVLFGGPKGGYTTTKKNGKEYVTIKERIIDGGVDFATLRVLGKNMLVDKNALYYRENVIPFDKLDGFKFIFKEM